MARKLFGPGARGDITGRIQRALTAAGFDPQRIDEVYGGDTVDAVTAFQTARKLPVTGNVDEATWSVLMREPVPAVSERSLALTAAFEDHGYTLAKGNFDGAWLTWGIIGFTMKAGQVQRIIGNVLQKTPQLVDQAFGENTPELLDILKAGGPAQKAWATKLTRPGGTLAEPWLSSFARFGSYPEVRAEQRRAAQDSYYRPALDTARRLGISTELGLALVFDIHVQNGGVSAAAEAQIHEDMAASHDSSEANLREIIAEAIANQAIPKYRDDVRTRKLTIAKGAGSVHGRSYDLSNWALADLAASGVAA